MLVLASRFYLN